MDISDIQADDDADAYNMGEVASDDGDADDEGQGQHDAGDYEAGKAEAPYKHAISNSISNADNNVDSEADYILDSSLDCSLDSNAVSNYSHNPVCSMVDITTRNWESCLRSDQESDQESYLERYPINSYLENHQKVDCDCENELECNLESNTSSSSDNNSSDSDAVNYSDSDADNPLDRDAANHSESNPVNQSESNTVNQSDSNAGNQLDSDVVNYLDSDSENPLDSDAENPSESDANSNVASIAVSNTGRNVGNDGGVVLNACDGLDNSNLIQLCLEIKSNQVLQYKLVLFLHAMKHNMTHASYAAMVNILHPTTNLQTWSMRTNAGAPVRLKTLVDSVFNSISAILPIRSVCIPLQSGCHTTPYLLLKTVIFIWTSSPSILASLEYSNSYYTLPFISATSTLQTLSARIEVLQSYASTYGVERAETCVQHLDILRRTFGHWNPQYQANLRLPLHDRKHVLFIRFRFYNDDFGWMGVVKSTKANCLGCVTDPSIDPGLRASPGGLANLPIFLTSTQAVKDFGLNKVLELYTEELKELAKGINVKVGQQSYLIFAYAYDFIGDEPARARAMGLSPSVNTRLPCLKCITPKQQFAEVAKNPSKLGANRKSSSVQSLLAGNGGMYGTILGASKTIAATVGIECISVAATWPGQNIPECEKIDLMHAEFLGALPRHFAILTGHIKNKSLFKDMSRLFSVYVKLNHIPAEYCFHDEQSIKGLHGYGLKEFYLVSPWILLQLKAIEESNPVLVREFKFWCCRVRIVSILCMHAIPVNVYHELRKRIQSLLAYLSHVHPDEITFNVHLYHHVEENIIQYGPVRQYWCFVYEHMIKRFKGCYTNTNNRKVSCGVFRRVLATIMIELMDQINRSESAVQPVRILKVLGIGTNRVLIVDDANEFYD
ncbi:hypothetical protein BJ741DRAFT_715091 [Chytriomyces cf. hyalinus JEL632]|nr:hypothetical protein BJ741DRAFT_715091 [Chytriomyces cf. hyalinus JEL632]